jgi:hypothetical protein
MCRENYIDDVVDLESPSWTLFVTTIAEQMAER